MSGEGIFALTGDCEAMDEYDKRQRIEAMTTPSPTVIEEARKMAAEYHADTFGGPTLTQAFLAAIELGERRADAAVVAPLRAKEVPCPICGVDAGEMCRSIAAGKPLPDPHVARNRLARGNHRSKPA